MTPSGPPSIIIIKAVSMLNAKLRRELHNKAWESVTLEEICSGIAEANDMKLDFNAEDISIDRVDQTGESDLSFLAKLCDSYGCKIKIEDDTLFIFDEEIYEAKDVALTVSLFDMKSYNFVRQAHDLYKECKVVYFDANKKKTHKSTVGHKAAYTKNLPKSQQQSSNKNWQENLPEALKSQYTSRKSDKQKKGYSNYTYLDQANINGGGKTLVIRARVKSQAEAERLARAALRKKNKGEWGIDFSSIGNPNAIGGLVIEVEDCGNFDGIYSIDETTHNLTKDGGYTSSVKSHRVLGSWENQSDE